MQREVASEMPEGLITKKNQNESHESVRYILLEIKIYLKIAYISKKVLTT